MTGLRVVPVQVHPSVVVPARARVLRPHLPESASTYAEDRDPESRHFAILDADRIVAVGSSFRVDDGWRLRGMATLEERRGEGLGSVILSAIMSDIAVRGGGLVWCNARVTASRFYSTHGFRVCGESFELPEIGPHYRMEKLI